MKTIKMPVSRTSLAIRIASLREEARARLRKFCIDKIIENKLGTKIFNFSFDLDNRREGGQRKSVQKLRALIMKGVLKQIPFLSYASGDKEFLHDNNQNSAAIVLSFSRIPVEVAMDCPLEEAVHYNRQLKSISRYIRKLNSLSIKNKQNLRLTSRPYPTICSEDNELYSKVRDGRMNRATIRCDVAFKITVSIGYWKNCWFTAHRRSDQFESRKLTQSEFIDQIVSGELIPTSVPELAGMDIAKIFHESNWEFSTFTNAFENELFVDYASVEKIFLILKEMQKVIKTLARKTSYDSPAFNIGSTAD